MTLTTVLTTDYKKRVSLTTVRSSASPIPTVSKMCAGLREGQSLRGRPHILPFKFVFDKSQALRGKWRTHISAPFCAYASFINETPGLVGHGNP